MGEMTSSYAVPPRPECCELCGRAVDALTKHHLIPRTVHRKKRFRKRYSKEQMHTAILWLCRPCHRHIHVVLSEQVMAEQYASREALMSHPDIAEFVTWLSAKPPGFQPSSRRPKRS